jgi:hypothetical protein
VPRKKPCTIKCFVLTPVEKIQWTNLAMFYFFFHVVCRKYFRNEPATIRGKAETSDSFGHCQMFRGHWPCR